MTIGKYLTDKKVLLFIPYFFGYEVVIKRKIEELGAKVFLYNERSVKSAMSRALLKVVPCIFKAHSRKYFLGIMNMHEEEDFDYILIVRCDMMDKNMLQKLKEKYPQAKLCLHLWDSFGNVPGIREKLALFDMVTSFDKEDCKNNPILIFRPLFYADEFARQGKEKEEFQYDMSFCGTIHSDRYKVLKNVELQCKEKGLRFEKFYYLQSKFMFYFYKMTKREYRNALLSEFSLEKLSSGEIARIEGESRAVIDIQHPKQSGLTIRTIEMLGLGKKLITTNKDIVNYDFYMPENIQILDRDNPVIDASFFSKQYRNVSKEIYDKYSLETWIYDVLGIGDE